MIAIIDYDAGNVKSVEKAVNSLGEKTVITRNQDKIMNADKLILPGVGSFGEAMDKIQGYDLYYTIRDAVEAGAPILGICLGMQLLFEYSEESIGVPGMDLLKGRIRKIPSSNEFKIPHIGWNTLDIQRESKLLKGIDRGSYFYFVHSYYLKSDEADIVTSTTEYGGTCIQASVEKDNVFGCQFHPEKSSDIGMKILQNFINVGREE